MAIKKKPKWETKVLTIPNGTANDALQTASYTPDKDYGYVTKVWAKVMNLANQTYINLTLFDGAGTVVLDAMPSELWNGGTGVEPDKMMRSLFQGLRTGQTLKVGGKTPVGAAATNADIVIVFVFQLEDELVEVARV